jgi:hypothetical protein
MALFLRQCGTYAFEAGDPAELLAELHRRWKERRGDTAAPVAVPRPSAGAMEPGGVFINFANEDREAAWTMKAALEQAGLDEHELEPGIDCGPYIRRHIADCAVFVPLLSRRAQQKKKGYFRVEWREALIRLVRRDRLTVLSGLSGLSGLGKTSLHNAGLFPCLRENRFLPIRIRLAYGEDAPAPTEQVHGAVTAAIAEHGVDARPPAAWRPPRRGCPSPTTARGSS